jgi:hypothetical protein
MSRNLLQFVLTSLITLGIYTSSRLLNYIIIAKDLANIDDKVAELLTTTKKNYDNYDSA